MTDRSSLSNNGASSGGSSEAVPLPSSSTSVRAESEVSSTPAPLNSSDDEAGRPTLVADSPTTPTPRPSLVIMDIQEKIPALRWAKLYRTVCPCSFEETFIWGGRVIASWIYKVKRSWIVFVIYSIIYTYSRLGCIVHVEVLFYSRLFLCSYC